jgi:hypothetical protein
MPRPLLQHIHSCWSLPASFERLAAAGSIAIFDNPALPASLVEPYLCAVRPDADDVRRIIALVATPAPNSRCALVGYVQNRPMAGRSSV